MTTTMAEPTTAPVAQHRQGVSKVHVFAAALRAAEGACLDLGCGTGALMQYVGPRLRVVGLDLSPEFCRVARKVGEHVLSGDLGAGLPFRSASFQWAVCSDAFEHMVDPLALLGEIRRVLVPGGRLLCHVPNEFSYGSLRQVLRGDGICNRKFFPGAEEWNYPHIRFFSHRGFTAMLAHGGFTIETDLTDFGRGWRRRFYPLFGSGPSFVARRAERVHP
jgi:SAM-dependent methyltransferase